MREYYVVDRIEGEIIVLETFEGKMIKVNKSEVNSTIKEGDILFKDNKVYFFDEEATKKRRKIIKNISNDIWN